MDGIPESAAEHRPGASAAWDPVRYLRFAGERARPFVELLARVGAEAPGAVVDLGCGEGALTASLAQRWPGARRGAGTAHPPGAESGRNRRLRPVP